MLPENHALLAPHDALKFVVGSEEDLFAALATCRKLGFDQEGRAKPRFSVFLSPVAGSMDPARIVSFMIEHGMNYARLQVQLHKIVWPGQEKGV
jgi:7-carboxy-7-deazaguanine synthase